MRANGEGSHYQRKDGRHVSVLSWRDTDGKLKRASFYGATARQARDKYNRARQRLEESKPVTDSRQTLGQYIQTWQATVLEYSRRSASTKALYRSFIATHVAPSDLAGVKLAALRPSHLDRFLYQLQSKLAGSSVARVQSMLAVALNDAVRDDLLAVSPMVKVPNVRYDRPTIRPFTRTELARVMQHLTGTAGDVLKVIALTGMRRGEALSLKWEDYSVSSVRVTGSVSRLNGELVDGLPKTAGSRRVVPLTASVTEIVNRQPRRGPYIFSTATGGPIDPQNILRTMTRACKRAGVTGNVHLLRHTFTTLLMEQGTNIRTVADLLGHADTRLTAEVYGWTHPETAQAAVDGLADLLSV